MLMVAGECISDTLVSNENSPMEKTVNNLMSKVDCGQSGNNGLTMYSLRVRQIIDSITGFRMNTDIQEKRKARGPPKASRI